MGQNDAVLERLAERIEDRRRKLGDLVEEQHPVVSEAHFSRASHLRSATDHGDLRARCDAATGTEAAR